VAEFGILQAAAAGVIEVKRGRMREALHAGCGQAAESDSDRA
jgi:hypothetical protein